MALLAALIEPILKFLYFIIKDVLRGNPVKKKKKARDKVGKDFDNGFDA